MVTIFEMIDAPGLITLQSKFYTIKVGSDKRSQQQLIWLKKWCSINNVYLEKRSDETDNFLWNIAKSLGVKYYLLPKVLVNISVLYAHIVTNCTTPNLPSKLTNLHQQRLLTDPSYYLNCNTQSRVRHTS